MNQDDYSREKLQTQHPAEARLSKIQQAEKNMDAAVAFQLVIERPKVQPVSTDNLAPVKEAITITVPPQQQLRNDAALDIVDIRYRIGRIYQDQPTEVSEEEAA
jgi:hypothetical protein